MRNKPDRTIDLTLQQCPFTILEIGNALKTMQSGQVLEILSAAGAPADDVKAWCAATGEELLGVETDEGVRIYVRKH